MAVSGAPGSQEDGGYLHISLPSDQPYSPILETSSPEESNSPSPGPGGTVSPGDGKKRVRISESTSVRVIEEQPRAVEFSKFRVKGDRQGAGNSGFKPRALRFACSETRLRVTDRSEKEALLAAGEFGEEEEDDVKEERGFRGQEEEEDGEYEGSWDYGDGGGHVEYRDYTEMLCDVDRLTFQEDVLHRAESLESRDNPFLPGGDLSKEAEELLKKATIVRDKFYLQQEQEKLLQETKDQKLQQLREQEEAAAAYPDHLPQARGRGDDVDMEDGRLPNRGGNSPLLEERISPTLVSQAEAAAAAPPSQLRENGKATGGDTTVTTDASPDKVRLEVGESPTADGRGTGGAVVVVVDSDAEQQDKDKARRRPKCCLLM